MGKVLSRKEKEEEFPEPKEILPKIGLFGVSGGGKSSIVQQWMYEIDIELVEPTDGGESYQKEVRADFDKKKHLVQILDLAGEVGNEKSCYVRLLNSFIFVYSVTSRTSFNEIRSFYDHIHDVKGIEVLGVLVGNKIDLESKREVSTKEGEELGRALQLPFLEMSAHNKMEVEELFQLLLTYQISGEPGRIAKNIKHAKRS